MKLKYIFLLKIIIIKRSKIKKQEDLSVYIHILIIFKKKRTKIVHKSFKSLELDGRRHESCSQLDVSIL